MRSAEEYYNEYINMEGANKSDFIEILNKARSEAIMEASEAARIVYWDGFNKTGKQIEYFQSGADNLQISKESILQLLNQIK